MRAHQSYFDYIKTIPGVILACDLGEKHGPIAYDRRRGNNGAHVGVTLGQPGIGDGRPSPLYDGINDYTNIFTPALQAAFNGAEGTVALWVRVWPGAWTDGAWRYAVEISVDINNRVGFGKTAANNTLAWWYHAGGVVEQILQAGFITLDFMQLVITWSVSAGVTGEMKAYQNGLQVGATQVGLGIWVGLPLGAMIGQWGLGGGFYWHGWEAHGFVLNRAAGPQEIRQWYIKGKQQL